MCVSNETLVHLFTSCETTRTKHCVGTRLLWDGVKYRTEYRISLAIRKTVNDASACRILIENVPVKISAPIRSCRGEDALGGQSLSSFFSLRRMFAWVYTSDVYPAAGVLEREGGEIRRKL